VTTTPSPGGRTTPVRPPAYDRSAPVGLAEIGQRLGVKPQTVRAWKLRGLLPSAPDGWKVGGQDCWPWGLIEDWAAATGRLS
jgi:hypothetical protein